MAVGDSDNTYDDDFHMEAADWIVPPDIDKEMVRKPADIEKSKQIEDIDNNYFSGMGTPVGWFSKSEAAPIPPVPLKTPAERNAPYPSVSETNVEGLGVDTGNELFIKPQGGEMQGRAYRTEFKSGMHDSQILSRMTEDASLQEKIEASIAFGKAEIAKHRSAIATLGYDPTKVVLEREDLNVAGMYDDKGKTDRILLRLPNITPSALMHESGHRGMTMLENQSPEAREIIDDMRSKVTNRYKDTRASDVDEYIIRNFMATKMGDPENIPEHNVSIRQRAAALKMFKENPDLQKGMDRLEEIAAELVKNKTQGKPR